MLLRELVSHFKRKEKEKKESGALQFLPSGLWSCDEKTQVLIQRDFICFVLLMEV